MNEHEREIRGMTKSPFKTRHPINH
jgi:hypothetical protein